jgi:hypothetical protein
MIVDYAASHARGGTTTIVITATDPHGKSSSATITARVDACQPIT